MNIDRSAFDLRRELGIVIGDGAAVRRLSEAFEEDWRLSHRYHPPDPLQPDVVAEDDFPHDSELRHE
jgi:phosphatidylserine/phosphatidylglycerophosphate/cardiolipin synthase-like enzyme